MTALVRRNRTRKEQITAWLRAFWWARGTRGMGLVMVARGPEPFSSRFPGRRRIGRMWGPGPRQAEVNREPETVNREHAG